MDLAVYTLLLTLLGTAVAIDIGQRHAKRIIGGNDTTTDKWPFVCSIYNKELDYHMCAGSLLKGNTAAYLLTTASCFAHRNVGEEFEAFCYHHNLREPSNFQRIAVQNITLHEDYDLNTFRNDIALLELVMDPTDLEEMQAVSLPSRAANPDDEGTVMGWGATSEQGPGSEALQELNMTFVDDARCADAYDDIQGYFQPPSMICTHVANGTGGSCTQDGGGPFVVQRNGNYEVAAIVSWGYGCAREEYPDVFTNIFFYLDWIREKIPGIIM